MLYSELVKKIHCGGAHIEHREFDCVDLYIAEIAYFYNNIINTLEVIGVEPMT